MGTAAYLAPEQILGVRVGSAADVYSLGLVLLECLTGELEYPGLSKVESALTRLHRQPRIPADIPGVLAELLGAMTARDADARPAARDCAAWFWAVRESDGVSGRAARAAAANWLAKKGKQFRRPRVPALRVACTGWRRFAVAGAGLAMAILASAWLFTSLLPRFSPLPPTMDEAAPPPAQVGIAPHIGAAPDGPVMHAAAVLAGDTPRPPAPPPGSRGADGRLITSALFGAPAVTTTPVPRAGAAAPGNASGNGNGQNQGNGYGVGNNPHNQGDSPTDPPAQTQAGTPTGGPTPTDSATPSDSATPTDTRAAAVTTTTTPPPDPAPSAGSAADAQPATSSGLHLAQ
jgi:hypothetical protein